MTASTISSNLGLYLLSLVLDFSYETVYNVITNCKKHK